MRARFKFGAGAVVFCMAAAQLIRPNTANPPVNPSRSLWRDPRVDARAAGVLRRACANCHSHETEWPWYSNISPVSWIMAGHVSKGRAKLNFSDWSGASANQMEEIYDAIDKGDMPPRDYRMMHPEARLSNADREILKSWTRGTSAQVH